MTETGVYLQRHLETILVNESRMEAADAALRTAQRQIGTIEREVTKANRDLFAQMKDNKEIHVNLKGKTYKLTKKKEEVIIELIPILTLNR